MNAPFLRTVGIAALVLGASFGGALLASNVAAQGTLASMLTSQANPRTAAPEDRTIYHLWDDSSADDSWCSVGQHVYAFCWGSLDWEEAVELVSTHPRTFYDAQWQAHLHEAMARNIGIEGRRPGASGHICRQLQSREEWNVEKRTLKPCPSER
jgi:hypothetical protein